MGTLQGLAGVCMADMISRSGLWGCQWNHRGGIKVGGFWGCKGSYWGGIKVGDFSHGGRKGRFGIVQCSFSSYSSDNDSMAENFNEKDEEFVNSSVVDAVEVKSMADGFMIKMQDGRLLRCVQNNPQGLFVPDYVAHPAIVLKMEDGSDLLLPIFASEMPSTLLTATVHNVPIVRPALYQITKDMIEKMGYVVKLVQVTERIQSVYFAQLYLSKVGNETETVSFALRPSDAINIAVRCKAPIQVNKYLAYSDGVRVVDSENPNNKAPPSDAFLSSNLDRPDGKPCYETKEFDLARNMLIAAVEERYRDAARWRDKLTLLRHEKMEQDMTRLYWENI